MNKKKMMGVFLSIAILLGAFAVFADKKNSAENIPNISAVKITLKKKIASPMKEFTVTNSENKKIPFIVNKLDDKNYVLVPLQISKDLKLQSTTENNIVSVTEYKGEIFVQNRENLNKIKEQYAKEHIRDNKVLYDGGFLEKSAGALKSAESAGADTNSSSQTNVQVKGVDEADIVKVVSNNIFFIKNNSVYVAKTNNGKLSQESVIKFENDFYIRDLYVDNTKLVAIGDFNRNNKFFAKAVTYDISNLKSPKIYRTLSQEGGYQSSRKIGNQVYIVSQTYLSDRIPMPMIEDSVSAKKTQSVDLATLRFFPPYYTNSVVTIGSFSQADKNIATHTSFLGNSESVYMNDKNLYISYNEYSHNYLMPVAEPKIQADGDNQTIIVAPDQSFYEKTVIKKFSVNNGKMNYVGEARIDGHLINQFAMDESGGYFRVAYTKDSSSGSEVAVFDGKMNPVGKLTGIAPTERIYSARFMGDRLYLVTFKQVDPFFVIDLKNPKQPSILGYLKIPGYSDYLHPYDKNHIIGFGKSTESNGFGGVRNDGMKIAMFDVTDVKNPKQISGVTIGTYGTDSELLYNHKALMYHPQKSLFGFPITVSEKSSKGKDYYDTFNSFQGGFVYEISKDYKINFKGKTTHSSSKEWDYNYEAQVQRLVYVGDYIYSLSEKGISSNKISDMSQVQMLEWSVQ